MLLQNLTYPYILQLSIRRRNRIIGISLLSAAILLLVSGGYYAYLVETATLRCRSTSSEIYAISSTSDVKPKLIATGFDRKHEKYRLVKYNKIPQSLIHAITAFGLFTYVFHNILLFAYLRVPVAMKPHFVLSR